MNMRTAAPVLTRLVATLQNQRETIQAQSKLYGRCSGVAGERVIDQYAHILAAFDLLIDSTRKRAIDTAVDARNEDFMEFTSLPAKQDVGKDAINGVVQVSSHGSVSEAA